MQPAANPPETPLDLPSPPRWRRFLPTWLRDLFWQDAAKSYDAFLSYAWKSDRRTASVVQSVIQRFLCPWCRVRQKTVFRDLSCLPAGVNFRAALCDRMKASTHFVVLASPEAADSSGMKFEAEHWLATKGVGSVIVLVTSGGPQEWAGIRDTLLPPPLREPMQKEPIWIDISQHRDAITKGPLDAKLRKILVEALNQLLLCFYTGQTWEELSGQERQRRLRARALVVFTFVIIAGLCTRLVNMSTVAESESAGKRAAVASARNLAVFSAGNAASDLIVRRVILREVADPAPAEWPAIATAATWGVASRAIFEGHSGEVHAIAFSSDGKRVLTGSYDGTARVWKGEEPGYFSVLGQEGPKIFSVAFSPDGKTVATGSDDGTVRIWNPDRPDHPIEERKDHMGPVTTVAFSPHGGKLLTASWDSTARLWNADLSGEPVLMPHGGAVSAAAFAAADDKIVTGSHDGKVRVWAADGALLIPPMEQGSPVDAVAFSPDGTQFVSGADDGTVFLWSAARPSVATPVDTRPGQNIRSVAFSRDGSEVLTVAGNLARIVNVAGQAKPVDLDGHSSAIGSAVFGPDGRVLTAFDDGTARVWSQDGSSFIELKGHSRRVVAAIFSPDGKEVLTASEDRTARSWDAQGATEPILLGGDPAGETDGLTSVAVSPDGKRVVAGSAHAAFVWDASGAGPTTKLDDHGKKLDPVVFRPDGQKVVTGSDDGVVRMWNVDGTGGPVPLTHDRGAVFSLAYAANGKLVVGSRTDHTSILNADGSGSVVSLTAPGMATVTSVATCAGGAAVLVGSHDGVARLWNSDGGQPRKIEPPPDREARPQEPEGLTPDIEATAFSPDCQRFVTGSDDDRATIWKLTGTGTQATPLLNAGAVFSAAFNRAGKVATGSNDMRVRVWDFDGHGTVLGEFAGAIESVAFSPDGHSVLAVSKVDTAARLWSADTAGPAITFEGHSKPVSSATFSPDGQKVVTASADGTSRVWTLAFRTVLWRQTPYCLPVDQRIATLGEDSAGARQGYERCVSLSRACRPSFEACQAAVAAIDGSP